jgi:hypothetical protein
MFWQHPKFLMISEEATALWIRALAYTNGSKTDGFVPSAALCLLSRSKRSTNVARELVAVGLWETVDGGWMFHDWSEYQPSRESVIASRGAAAERAQRSRERRAARHGDGAPHVTSDVTPHVTRDVRGACASPDPTRPDPTRPESESAPPNVVEFDAALRRRAEVRGYLVRAYQVRYEREARDAWMGLPRAGQHVDEVLAWVLAQAEPFDAIDRLMDAVFETPRFRGRRWPWAWIAEDPGAIVAASTAPVGRPVEPLHFEEA